MRWGWIFSDYLNKIAPYTLNFIKNTLKNLLRGFCGESITAFRLTKPIKNTHCP